MSKLVDLSVSQTNNQVPFCPSISWDITNSDIGNPKLYTFNWIQAFFATGTPQLVVQTTAKAADGTFICAPIPFAYSGERVFFKGKVLVASGKDRFGDVITASTIGTDITRVVAYGGFS